MTFWDKTKINYLFVLEEPQDLSLCSTKEFGSKMEVDDSDNDHSDSDVDYMEKPIKDSLALSSVRPQIIVTPRKVASAIESATAAVLAKNKKASLAECTSDEIPIGFIPMSVFDVNQQQPQQLIEESSGAEENTDSKASSKSVIVRAGCFLVSL